MRAMSLPITLTVRDRKALVVGGGEAALKKATALHAAGARLLIVAPQFCEPLQALLSQSGIDAKQRPYETEDMTNVFLAVAATDDDSVNARVVADAQSARVLVCDASLPERSDFAFSATVQIGDLTFAVDTGGAAPAFAKRLTDELRDHFGESYAAAVRTLRRMRSYVKQELPKDERAGVLRALAGLPVDQLAAPPVESAVCATRASALAMIQARSVAAKVAQRGIATTFLNVTTTGDRVTDRPIAAIGSESLFVKELETALRSGNARYAVHSCKDLPSTLPPDMHIAAISLRADPRDIFCSERFDSFAALPPGSRVGTSSNRRRAQLIALRADLEYLDLRGNVDTRLRKLREGQYDAIVLAAAGVQRLDARAQYMQPFSFDEIVPAAGQGALAVEVLADDTAFAGELRAAVNDTASELAILCERAALRELRGGCQAPIGVHAYWQEDVLHAIGAVAAMDGSRVMRAALQEAVSTIADCEQLGIALAAALTADQPLSGKLVVLPRTQDRPSRIADALRAEGAEVVEMRSGETEPPGLAERIPDVIVFASSGSVGAAAAYLSRVHRFDRRPAIVAMGPASSAAAHAAGFTPDLVAPEAAAEALVATVGALYKK